MRNILIITQKVDEQDDLLGFFVDWIREFSKYFDHIYVIALGKGTFDLPKNVHVYSLGKERSTSKFSKLINFYYLLFMLVPKSSGIFAHMSPVFVIASWPVAFLFRKKIIFWYLHRSVTSRLKVAEVLCYKIVTAAKESLKFNSKKIVETGHGISLDKFRTERDWSSDKKLRILSVGRISKIKNYETLIKAAKIMKEQGVDFEIRIIGKPVMQKDGEYLKSLQALINDYQLQSFVNLLGFVPYSQIAAHYKEANVVVGLTPQGGIDKTILEGMASGCIVFTSNNAFNKYLNHYAGKLIFRFEDSAELAEKITSLNQAFSEYKKSISDFMVSSVFEHHRLGNVVKSISSLL